MLGAQNSRATMRRAGAPDSDCLEVAKITKPRQKVETMMNTPAPDLHAEAVWHTPANG